MIYTRNRDTSATYFRMLGLYSFAIIHAAAKTRSDTTDQAMTWVSEWMGIPKNYMKRLSSISAYT